MFHRVVDTLKNQLGPVRPRQGQRLRREQFGDTVIFIIKGTRWPGFFVFFGLFFGGIPFLLMLGFLSGETQGVEWVFGALFMLPFVLTGAICSFIGFFLWFGKTTVQLDPGLVTVRRFLLGRPWQTKTFQRKNLVLNFQESHRTNGRPSYKLSFGDGRPRDQIGVGGSLPEAELLWLEHEIRVELEGRAARHRNVSQAITKNRIKEVQQAAEIPGYRSKGLHILKTPHGWEARLRSGFLAGFIGMLVGALFLIIGLSVMEPTREIMFDFAPSLRKILTPENDPPVWFGAIFATLGALALLSGLWLLGHRFTIAQRHARLYLTRRWFFLGRTSIKDTGDLRQLVLKVSGEINRESYFTLTAIWHNGRKTRLTSCSSGPDTGQLWVRLNALANPSGRPSS